MNTILQQITSGLLLGGIIAMMSMGVALIFGVMNVINFAHADFMMIGMYFVIWTYAFVQLNPLVLALGSVLALALLGLIVYRLCISPIAEHSTRAVHSQEAQLIVTLGLSLILENVVLLLLGPGTRALPTTSTTLAWSVGPVLIDQPRLVGFAVAVVSTAVLFLLLHRTRFGRTIRAAADNAEAATYMGIDVRRTHSTVFAIGSGLAGLSGGILVTYYPVHPSTGADFILLMFASVILGGLGNVVGAMVGGLIIGLLQALSVLVMPLQLRDIGVFVVFLVILVLRPNGIFGKARHV